MPTRRSGWINWRTSACRPIVLNDLVDGVLPVDENEMPAEVAWELCYKHMAEFVTEGVQFDQFKERLKDHRKQIGDDIIRAQFDRAAVAHDRRLFPRKERNHHGKLVFDMHPSKHLLREDVIAGRHLLMKPSELRSTRPEYQEFEKKIFKHRIYQEVRYQKFLTYLEQRRAEGKL